MNTRVAAISSWTSAIMAAFDSSVPRMISMYFDIVFSSPGGPPLGPCHPHVERAAHGSTRRRKFFRRAAADPCDPRTARQIRRWAMADADALLIRKLNVAARQGGNARTGLRTPA